MTQSDIRKLVKEVLPLAEDSEEWLAEPIVSRYNLCSPSYAMKNIHFPVDSRQVKEARYRMVFEELLVLQTGLFYIKNGRTSEGEGISIKDVPLEEFTNRLSFELTEGQKRVWEETSR